MKLQPCCQNSTRYIVRPGEAKANLERVFGYAIFAFREEGADRSDCSGKCPGVQIVTSIFGLEDDVILAATFMVALDR